MTKLADASGGVILFLILASCWQYVAYKRQPEWGGISYCFYFLLLGRGMIAVLNAIYQVLPPQKDALLYHETATLIAADLARWNFSEVLERVFSLIYVEPGYSFPLGIFYWIFGSSTLVGFVLNTFFFSLTAVNVYRIGRMCFSETAGKFGAIVLLMLPYSVLHSTYLYRDPLVNFFISEFFYRLLQITSGHKLSPLQWVWVGFVFVYSGILRRENLVMLTAISGFLMFMAIVKSKTLLKPVIIVLALGFTVAAGLYLSTRAGWLLSEFNKLVQLEALSQRMESFENAQSGYLVGQQFNSYWDLVRYAPIRAIYFVFSPFPWDIFKKSQYIPMFEAWVVGVFLVALPWALNRIRKWNIPFFYAAFIYLAGGILGAGLIQSNSAGAQRHRTQFTFLIVAIGASYLYDAFLKRLTLGGRSEPVEEQSGD